MGSVKIEQECEIVEAGWRDKDRDVFVVTGRWGRAINSLVMSKALAIQLRDQLEEQFGPKPQPELMLGTEEGIITAEIPE